MSNICEKIINACIAADCDAMPYNGAESMAYIGNKSQLTGNAPTEVGSPNIVTQLPLASDAKLYSILQLGKQPYEGTQTTLVEGNTSNKFTNTVQFIVPDNSPSAAKILDGLSNGKFFVIIPNEFDGSDHKGKYQVYGLKKGLVATGMERSIYGDVEGWTVTLTEENAPDSALFIVHETSGTEDTKDYLDGLLADC